MGKHVIAANGNVFTRGPNRIPHTTTDGRGVFLAEWGTFCATCGAPYIVRTLFDATELSRYFLKVLCPVHASLASKQARRQALIKARAVFKENCAKRRALKGVKTPKRGSTERVVLRLLEEAAPVMGPLLWEVLADAVCLELPPPEGKRDRRRELAVKAIDSLAHKGVVVLADGIISLA